MSEDLTDEELEALYDELDAAGILTEDELRAEIDRINEEGQKGEADGHEPSAASATSVHAFGARARPARHPPGR